MKGVAKHGIRLLCQSKSRRMGGEISGTKWRNINEPMDARGGKLLFLGHPTMKNANIIQVV